MKLKGLYFADVAEIQEAITDELEKAPKGEFLADFQKLNAWQKPLYMPMKPVLNLKKRNVSSLYVFDF